MEGVSKCCSVPITWGQWAPWMWMKQGLQVDLESLMTHPADLERFPHGSHWPLDPLEGAGMCKITGSAHSGRVSVSSCVYEWVCTHAHSLKPDTVALERLDTLLPLIIQRTHSFPLLSYLSCGLQTGGFKIFPTFISLLHSSMSHTPIHHEVKGLSEDYCISSSSCCWA